MSTLDECQTTLETALATVSQTHLDKVPAGDERTVGEQLTFLFWHEGYHVGQTEYLRQLAGKDDKII